MKDNYTLLLGDCIDTMKTLDADSVDSIVTDPPYGLEFLGKNWDGAVPGVAFWKEALRVAKPGAHILAFGGTRTFHRLAVAIEDAGWEIRDTVMWVYGSGFPKSHDVSKAIDKRGGNAHLTAEIGAALKAARKARGISVTEADRIYCGGVTLWSWYEGRSAGQHMPTAEVLSKIAKDWPELQRYADATEKAEREVVGQKKTCDPVAFYAQAKRGDGIVDITVPATDAARQWDGWGTALKPAWEPIIVARKPLIGTVGANVLQYGTGAMNIDKTRVAMGDEYDPTKVQRQQKSSGTIEGAFGASALVGKEIPTYKSGGRWPANVIHDGSEEVTKLFPIDKPKKMVRNSLDDSGGSTARFFYCAKASRSDREEGLDDMEKKEVLIGAEGHKTNPTTGKPVVDIHRANIHPTVKPTDLMRYLCRLVTPPKGIVLDPFMGSGSTGKAAMLEGFRFIGCEMNKDYMEIAERRIKHASESKNKGLEELFE